MSRIFIVGLIAIALSACSSSSGGGRRMWADTDNSHAPAEAYAAEAFTFRKGMPNREYWKPWEFYYKHCSINGNEAFYSKTSYDCSGPFY